MKRILCIIAMVMAVLYLAAGSGVLVFQNLLKPRFLDSEAAMVMTYPASTIAQLLLAGLPCAVLAAVSLAGSHKDSRVLSGVTVAFCSVVLICHSLVSQLLNTVNNSFTARMYGAAYLASLSTVNTLFGYTRILIDAALVLLLISSMMQAKE